MAVKLSEAIRAGAKLRPQGFGAFVTTDVIGQKCTCALGAAYESLFSQLPPGNWIPDHVVDDIIEACDIEDGEALKYPWPSHPRGEDLFVEITEAITRLNDDECWTREQIADWLAGVGF